MSTDDLGVHGTNITLAATARVLLNTTNALLTNALMTSNALLTSKCGWLVMVND